MDGSFDILLIGGIHRYVPVYYIIPKCRINRGLHFCSSNCLGWAAHRTVLPVACISDSEILAVLQTVKAVVRTQRHRLDADMFLMFSVG